MVPNLPHVRWGVVLGVVVVVVGYLGDGNIEAG